MRDRATIIAEMNALVQRRKLTDLSDQEIDVLTACSDELERDHGMAPFGAVVREKRRRLKLAATRRPR